MAGKRSDKPCGAEKRLWSEFEDIRNANMKGVWDIEANETNIWKWNALIVPDSDIYNKGAFRVEINLQNYPFRPPKILFLTKIYHTCVDEEGYIDMEILNKRWWRPSIDIAQILRSLVDHVNDILWFDEGLKRKAREMTEKFSEKRPDYDRPPPKEVGRVAKRLRKELQEIRDANLEWYKNIQVDDIWTWRLLLVPDAAPYNKGVYRIEINFRPLYPLKPPIMIFLTKIYHPNVSGRLVDMHEICTSWNSSTKMIEVLQALPRLLNQPDPRHFRPSEVEEVYRENRDKFLRTAEEFAKQFAEKISDECSEPEGRCLPFSGSSARTEKDIIVSPEISEKGQCHTLKATQPFNNDEEAAMEKGAEFGAFSAEILVEGKNVKTKKLELPNPIA